MKYSFGHKPLLLEHAYGYKLKLCIKPTLFVQTEIKGKDPYTNLEQMKP